jgi:hypothetical protein
MAFLDLSRKMVDGIRWRVNKIPMWNRKSSHQEAWVRVVMNRATRAFVDSLDTTKLKVLEIGGSNWSGYPFSSYESIDFPEYDVCVRPYFEAKYDLIILEQVLEHVLWPFRAVKNINAMLLPGGHTLITTPFLVKVHAYPTDCTRWTEQGIRYLLAEGGFRLEDIQTNSWGNRQAVSMGFEKVSMFRPWYHSLENEPKFPVMVWAIATKSIGTS